MSSGTLIMYVALLTIYHCPRKDFCSQEEAKLTLRLVDALRARSQKELEPHIAYLVVIGRTVRL